MKNLIAILAIVIASVTNAQVKSQPADTAKGFDVDLFQKYLVDEMYIQFYELDLDTNLNYLLRARSQDLKKAGTYNSAYVMKTEGDVDIQANEKEEAQRLVKYYKEVTLPKRTYKTEKDLRNCSYDRFSALAVNVNGSIRYSLIIDNSLDFGKIEGKRIE